MKTNILLIAILIVFFTSCGDDNPTETNDNLASISISQATLAGDYTTSFITSEGELTYKEDGEEPQTTTFQTTATMIDLKWSFTTSGTFTISGTSIDTITETTNGQTTTESQTTTVDQSGTYTVKEGAKILTLVLDVDAAGEGAKTYNIVSLSEDALLLKDIYIETEKEGTFIEKTNIKLSRT